MKFIFAPNKFQILFSKITSVSVVNEAACRNFYLPWLCPDNNGTFTYTVLYQELSLGWL